MLPILMLLLLLLYLSCPDITADAADLLLSTFVLRSAADKSRLSQYANNADADVPASAPVLSLVCD